MGIENKENNFGVIFDKKIVMLLEKEVFAATTKNILVVVFIQILVMPVKMEP